MQMSCRVGESKFETDYRNLTATAIVDKSYAAWWKKI